MTTPKRSELLTSFWWAVIYGNDLLIWAKKNYTWSANFSNSTEILISKKGNISTPYHWIENAQYRFTTGSNQRKKISFYSNNSLRAKQLDLLPQQIRNKVDVLREEMTDRFEELKRKWREGPCTWNFSWGDFQWASTMVITRAIKVSLQSEYNWNWE